MKVLVVGAGVTGTTTAWYLSQAGHDVTVVDRQDGPAMETSFANGGQMSPCHAEPWANPHVLPRLMKWLGRDDAPLLFRWRRWDPDLWRWGLAFLLNCRASRAEINTLRTLAVALYSRHCLGLLRQRLALDYDQKTLGILHVYRDGRQFAQGRAAARLMGRHGLERVVCDPAACVALEPALADVAPTLAGGIHTPTDESGDVHKFTRQLADHATRAGVTFRFGVTVRALAQTGATVNGILTDQGAIGADAVVLAAAAWSPLLSRPAGLRLPIVPAKGYSITVPVGDADLAPTVSVTDDEHKMVYSRLGQRLRAAGTAEMTGHDTTLTEARWRLVAAQARALFPRAGDYDHVEPWTGLRPVTPDSVPLIGRTRIPGLWLNTGHGTLGWTMACGSAQALADEISDRQPQLDLAQYSPSRFHGLA